MQNHVTAQDRYISTLEKSIDELSKASASSSTSPFHAFSEQKTVQFLVNEVKAIKQQYSSSNLCALQKKVASTDSKLDLILAKLSGSNERSPEPKGEKAQQNRAMLAEKDKELILQQGMKDPSLKVSRRKDVHFSKPLIILEPTTQSKPPHSDPNDKGKELAKETQMQIDEELAKQLKAKELKSKQKMLQKRNLYRSRPKKGVKVIKPTNSFTPPSDLTKENWDILAPPNGMKFNLWPSAIYPAEVDLDIEDLKKRFFLKKPIQVFPVWSKIKTASINKIDIQKFRKMPYAFFQGRRAENYEFMFSEADFPRINQDDIRSLIIWLKQRVSTDKTYADVLQRLRQYVLDMVIDFSVDWEIGQLREKESEEPNVNLNMENESSGNILKKPHRGVVCSSKGRLKFMRISQKHLLSSEFVEGIIGLLKRIGDQEELLRAKIFEELTWFLSFRQWLINLRNKI
ncbi:unnamed protein product [Lactuca saligna]|uniref:Uncharacterized protein n=1 Tax=Lactuca saligna TaxID=75948 RepID=A0AA36EGB7_LACSI|nr:unnamed protein product [Lactuca saligna]